jgi:hypothetical protein
VIEKAISQRGLPNGYVLGEEAQQPEPMRRIGVLMAFARRGIACRPSIRFVCSP